MKLLDSLKGWKTYIIALGAIVTATGAYLNNSITLTQLVESVFAALGTLSMRAAIAKGPTVPPAALIAFACLLSFASLTYAGPEPVPAPFAQTAPEIKDAKDVAVPGPTPVVFNEGTLTEFANSIIAAKSLSLGIYPSYRVDGAWGYGIAAGYPLGDWLFAGLRLDALAGNWYAASATLGAKYQFSFGKFQPTVFGVTGVNSPISGANEQNQSVGAILGLGAYIPLWQSSGDHRFTFGVFGEGEYWSQFDKILIVHAGAWANYHF